MNNPTESYTQSLDVSPVDPEREWSRASRDMGMMSPHRGFDRASEAGIIGNRGRAMESSRKYTQGYSLAPVTSVNSRNTYRNSFANMEMSSPAQVLDVTKPMG